MNRSERRALMVAAIALFNQEKRDNFHVLRNDQGKRYNKQQIDYAFELIKEHGVRGTCRVLQLPRRNLAEMAKEIQSICC